MRDFKRGEEEGPPRKLRERLKSLLLSELRSMKSSCTRESARLHVLLKRSSKSMVMEVLIL